MVLQVASLNVVTDIVPRYPISINVINVELPPKNVKNPLFPLGFFIVTSSWESLQITIGHWIELKIQTNNIVLGISAYFQEAVTDKLIKEQLLLI